LVCHLVLFWPSVFENTGPIPATLQFAGATYYNTMTKLQFPVGIEIETGPNGRVGSGLFPQTWSQGTDSSCGLEFRSSKIEDTDALFEDTSRACNAIRQGGCTVHPRCGLHVHIGFKQIDDLGAKYRLFRFVSVYENLFFEIMPPWFDRTKYCVKLTDALWQSFQRGEGFNWWKNQSSRYWWFNGAAMFKHGTVEFRHMNGTTDENEILGWVSVLQCMFNATVIENVKLNWCDVDHGTRQNLVADLRCETNALFGNRAANFILSK
jgi:hypothetical protein